MRTKASPVGLVTLAVLLSLVAGDSRSQGESPLAVVHRREAADSARGVVASQLARSEKMPERWTLRNVSGKPIDAWQLACVYGLANGRWAWSGPGADRFASPPGRDPEAWEDRPLVAPEETFEVSIPAAPDRSSPYEVWSCAPAAVIFSDTTTWGSPRVLDRLFARRVEQAREAIRLLEALERIGSPAARGRLEPEEIASVLDPALPEGRLGSYRQEIARVAGRGASSGTEDALDDLAAAVRRDIDQMLAELRPEDLDRLAADEKR